MCGAIVTPAALKTPTIQPEKLSDDLVAICHFGPYGAPTMHYLLLPINCIRQENAAPVECARSARQPRGDPQRCVFNSVGIITNYGQSKLTTELNEFDRSDFEQAEMGYSQSL
jgi:hypothetical protein